MARALTSGVIAQLTSGRVRPAVFVSIVFTSGTSFFWTGVGPKVWNSQTWTGVGNLGEISQIQETTDVAAVGITLALNGIPSGLVNQALGECRQGNAVKVWFGFLDAADAVIADPYQSFAGRMDVPTIADGADTATISITVENRLIDLQRSRERRYTHEDQQLDFPGDLGFQYVASLQQWNGVWGQGSPLPGPASNYVGQGANAGNPGGTPVRLGDGGGQLDRGY